MGGDIPGFPPPPLYEPLVPKLHLFFTLNCMYTGCKRTAMNLSELQRTTPHRTAPHRTAPHCCQKQVFLELLAVFQECASAIVQVQLTAPQRTEPHRSVPNHTAAYRIALTPYQTTLSANRRAHYTALPPNLDSTSTAPQPN